MQQNIVSVIEIPSEVYITIWLLFICSDHCSNSEEQEVSHAHHKLEDCLKEQLSRKHKDQPNLYDNLVTFRRELTFVATLFRSQVTKLKAHHYKFPGLFVEMFELSPFWKAVIDRNELVIEKIILLLDEFQSFSSHISYSDCEISLSKAIIYLIVTCWLFHQGLGSKRVLRCLFLQICSHRKL